MLNQFKPAMNKSKLDTIRTERFYHRKDTHFRRIIGQSFLRMMIMINFTPQNCIWHLIGLAYDTLFRFYRWVDFIAKHFFLLRSAKMNATIIFAIKFDRKKWVQHELKSEQNRLTIWSICIYAAISYLELNPWDNSILTYWNMVNDFVPALETWNIGYII